MGGIVLVIDVSIFFYLFQSSTYFQVHFFLVPLGTV
jgi:hypothetical protein